MYANENTEFACPDDARKILEALHSTHLLDALGKCHRRAASIEVELVHCTHFQLIDDQVLEEVGSRDKGS